MEKVIKLASRSDSSFHWTPGELLEHSLEELKPGAVWDGRKKMLILCLDDLDRQYSVSYRMAGMNYSQAIAMMEVVKASMLREMGY